MEIYVRLPLEVARLATGDEGQLDERSPHDALESLRLERAREAPGYTEERGRDSAREREPSAILFAAPSSMAFPTM